MNYVNRINKMKLNILLNYYLKIYKNVKVLIERFIKPVEKLSKLC